MCPGGARGGVWVLPVPPWDWQGARLGLSPCSQGQAWHIAGSTRPPLALDLFIKACAGSHKSHPRVKPPLRVAPGVSPQGGSAAALLQNAQDHQDKDHRAQPPPDVRLVWRLLHRRHHHRGVSALL